MGTRSVTTIFDEKNKPLVSFYRQFDGYYEGHGEELQEFLKEITIVNGFGASTPKKSANGMQCLAAQLIAHFKRGIGNIYIVPIGSVEEYNYEVRYVRTKDRGRVSLLGTCEHDIPKTFKLYSDEIMPHTILRKVQFVYDKQDGEQPKWRTVEVTDENENYIVGMEGGKMKRFNLNRIIGGKILPA